MEVVLSVVEAVEKTVVVVKACVVVPGPTVVVVSVFVEVVVVVRVVETGWVTVSVLVVVACDVTVVVMVVLRVLVTVDRAVVVVVTGGRLVIEVVDVVDTDPHSGVPWGRAGRLPPTIASSCGRPLFWTAPSTPHAVPYDVAPETVPQDPDFNTCNAGNRLTWGKAKTLPPCSSDKAWTGYVELETLAPMLKVPKEAPSKENPQVVPA